MQLIVPRKTSRLRQMLGGKKFEVTKEEEEELKEFDIGE